MYIETNELIKCLVARDFACRGLIVDCVCVRAATFEGDDRQDNDETGEEQEGGKRARQDDEGANAKRLRSGDTASYLKTLLEEEIKIIPFATVRVSQPCRCFRGQDPSRNNLVSDLYYDLLCLLVQVLPECSRLLQIEIQHVRGGGAPASSSFRSQCSSFKGPVSQRLWYLDRWRERLRKTHEFR